MNDLEPWKIWAVTALLVCVILGTTAVRVRPQEFGEASAQAAAMASGERSASIAATSPDTTADQYEGYPSYIPHRSFSSAVYSSVQASGITPLNNLLSGYAASSANQAEDYQEPQIDVAQQILDNQGSQADLLAANDGQSTHNWDLPLFYTANDQAQSDMFAAVPADHWAYAAVQDELAVDYDAPQAIGNSLVYVDPSGPTDARVLDLALRNVVLNVAINGSDSNGTVNLVQALSDSYGNEDGQPVEMDYQLVNPAQYQDLAISDEVDKELGDEQEVLDEARTQALRAELVQAGAQEQMQAAMQQRAEAVYTANVGKVYLQINGVQ